METRGAFVHSAADAVEPVSKCRRRTEGGIFETGVHDAAVMDNVMQRTPVAIGDPVARMPMRALGASGLEVSALGSFVELSADDLTAIDAAASSIAVHGARASGSRTQADRQMTCRNGLAGESRRPIFMVTCKAI